MADIFISYKSNRKAAAKHLERIFQLHGYTVWFDYSLMSGNEDFDIQILRELEAAKAVIVLWCPLSIQSVYVKDEARIARELDSYVGVIMDKGVQIPLGFGGSHLIDISEWGGGPRDTALDPLIFQITAKTGKQPQVQYKGLTEYHEIWLGMGGPALPQFKLLPLKKDPRPESKRQNLRNSDTKIKAYENDARVPVFSGQIKPERKSDLRFRPIFKKNWVIWMPILTLIIAGVSIINMTDRSGAARPARSAKDSRQSIVLPKVTANQATIDTEPRKSERKINDKIELYVGNYVAASSNCETGTKFNLSRKSKSEPMISMSVNGAPLYNFSFENTGADGRDYFNQLAIDRSPHQVVFERTLEDGIIKLKIANQPVLKRCD